MEVLQQDVIMRNTREMPFVRFPHAAHTELLACSNCHDADDPATPDAANWFEVPTAEACGACHDDVNFATGENHGPDIPADNTQCVSCHANNPASRIEVRQAHRLLEPSCDPA